MTENNSNLSVMLDPVRRNCACFNLRKAARAVTQLYDEGLKSTGLRTTQFTLLVATSLNDRISVTLLAERLVMDRTTLTRNLKPLREKELIEVLPGTDRRVKTLRITPQGRKALCEALPLWERVQQQVEEGLGQTAFKRLLAGLSKAVALSTAA